MNKHHIDFIFHTLQQRYPNPTTELHRETPFQLIVAVILSAQSTDKHINKVTKTLFQYVSEPQDVLDMGYEQFHDMLTSVNYHNNKAKNIYKLSHQLIELHHTHKIDNDSPFTSNIKERIKKTKTTAPKKSTPYLIPTTRKELRQLAGIGEKTAKVVLHVLYGQPLIAVDTHVHRVSNRLGLVETKTPEQTSKIIEHVIPEHYHDIAHHGLIFFGRRHCTARTPACTKGSDQCPFSHFCLYYKRYGNASNHK